MAVKLILTKEKYHQKFKDTYLQLEALVLLRICTQAFKVILRIFSF